MPNELKFFLGGNELKIHALWKIGFLNESNTTFLEFLKSSFGQDILNNNKMRTHLESRDIYIGNVNTSESTYNFLIPQQDDTKKLIDVEFIVSDDYNFHVEEFLVRVTDDLVDMHSNSTSKFLFYHFNNF